MHLPATFSLVLLAYLFLLLPWGAWKSAKHLSRMRVRKTIAAKRQGVDAAEAEARAMMTPGRIYLNTLINMGLLLGLAYMAAREMGYALFAAPHIGTRELVAGVVWFAASYAVGVAGDRWHTDDETRSAPGMSLDPRTGAEWLGYAGVALAAGIAEVAAYRGVGFASLQYASGSAIAAALLVAVAFALAHGAQGYKTMVIVFVKGLLVQGLVWYTGTLIIAMLGHALLDLLAAYRTRSRAAPLESKPAAP